ncbi:MAG: DUF4339 domain-containing protein [Thermoguttaceae bacterium]|nr:DUF4339 domain-containing protein [Thermoguttaceae bacterium]
MAKSGWYYLLGNQPVGPVSGSHLKELAATGRLKPTDLVWRPGLPGWVQARRVRGIFPQPPAAPSKEKAPPPSPESSSPAVPPSGVPIQEARTGGERFSVQAELAPSEIQYVPLPESFLEAPSVEEGGTGQGPASFGAATLPERPPGQADFAASPPMVSSPGVIPETAAAPVSSSELEVPPRAHVQVALTMAPRAAQGPLGELIQDTLQCVNSTMPAIFIGGLAVGAAASIILAAIVSIKVGAGMIILPLALVLVKLGLAVAGVPFSRMLHRLNLLAPWVDCDPLPVHWARTAAAGIWIVGLGGLLLATHHANTPEGFASLMLGFIGFVQAQAIALSILSFPGALTHGEAACFLRDPAWELKKLPGRILGWLARLLVQTVPTLAGLLSSAAAIVDLRLAYELGKSLFSPGVARELGAAKFLTPSAASQAEKINFGLLDLFDNLWLTLSAFLIVSAGWVLVPLCRLGWERLNAEDRERAAEPSSRAAEVDENA